MGDKAEATWHGADVDALRAEVEALRTERDEAQEHIAYHLRDFRPNADMKATGDLAVDMVAYASRWATQRDAARAERDSAVREAAALRALLRDMVDPDDCWFDHHGGCQAHGYLSLEPGELCPQAEAKALLAEHPTPEADRG